MVQREVRTELRRAPGGVDHVIRLPDAGRRATDGRGRCGNKEAFEWAIAVPDVVSASGAIARFLNDIASYKLGKNKKDVTSSVECYMKEHVVAGEEAAVAIAALAEAAWRTINGACMEIGGALLLAVQLVVNLTTTLEFIYLGGRDGYTFGDVDTSGNFEQGGVHQDQDQSQDLFQVEEYQAAQEFFAQEYREGFAD